MNSIKELMLTAALAAAFGAAACAQPLLAPTPPMGLNSWDSFGTTVTEDEVKANADYMAKNLKAHGWQYIVVDIQWSELNPKTHGYRPECRTGHGPIRPLDARPQPVPLCRQRQGLQALGRLRPLAGPEVRHPHHARHSAARRGWQPANFQQQVQSRRYCGQDVHLSLEHGHVRRRCRQAGRTGLLRFHRPALRLLGSGLRQSR